MCDFYFHSFHFTFIRIFCKYFSPLFCFCSDLFIFVINIFFLKVPLCVQREPVEGPVPDLSDGQ